MQLPGKLKDTTLGDLLGTLHRQSASGVLELIEPSGRRHHIDLREGEIEHVESDGGAPLLGDLLGISPLPEVSDDRRLGEALLDEGVVTAGELRDALRRQTLLRLDQLFSILHASIRFHAPRPQADDPTAPPKLERSVFLDGRPRNRSRTTESPEVPFQRRRSGALAVLGLCESATSVDIRRAFRELAQRHHPDRHPTADAQERLSLFRRFAEISRAYHTLTG